MAEKFVYIDSADGKSKARELKSSGTFTNADIDPVSFLLSVTHGLNTEAPLVVIYDNNGDAQSPQVKVVDADNITVDFTGYGTISGTWRIAVL